MKVTSESGDTPPFATPCSSLPPAEAALRSKLSAAGLSATGAVSLAGCASPASQTSMATVGSGGSKNAEAAVSVGFCGIS